MFRYKYVKRRMKTHTAITLSIQLILSLVIAFEFFVSIFFSCLDKTHLSQRQQLYGRWHGAVYDADIQTIHRLSDHATVEDSLIFEKIGTVSRDGYQFGTLGMSSRELELVDGRWPVGKNEIAVEMSALDAMNCSYELNQTVTLSLEVMDDQGEKAAVELEYVLTGIIRNYSSSWLNPEQQLQFFVSELPFNHIAVSLNCYIEMKAGFADTINELEALLDADQRLVLNTYTYTEYSQAVKFQDQADELFIYLIGLLCVFGSMLAIFNEEFHDQTANYYIMRNLGASKKTIFSLAALELFIRFFSGVIPGAAIGYFLSWLLVKAMAQIEWSVSYIQLSLIVVAVLLVFLVILLVEIIRICCMDFSQSQNNQSMRKSLRRKKKLIFSVNPVKKLMNTIFPRGKTVFIFSLILTVIFSLFISSFMQIKETITDLKSYRYDYEFSSMLYLFEPISHQTQEFNDRLRSIYGIDKVLSYQISNYLPLVWSDSSKSEYARLTSETIFKRYAGKELLYATVVSVSVNGNDDASYYIRECDEGMIDESDFYNGEEVILYLPEILFTEDGFLLPSDSDFEIKKWMTPELAVVESTIKTGETIYVDGYPLKVGGIIRKYDQGGSQSHLIKPYSVICSSALYARITRQNTVEFIAVKTNENANYLQTDLEISAIDRGEMPFSNFRIRNEQFLKTMMFNAMSYVCMGFVLLILGGAILLNRKEVEWKRKVKINSVLHKLGCSKKDLIKAAYRSDQEELILCILIGLILAFLSTGALLFVQSKSVEDWSAAVGIYAFLNEFKYAKLYLVLGIFTAIISFLYLNRLKKMYKRNEM